MATAEQPAGDVTQRLADEYLSDRIYDALLEFGEAAKVSEITLEMNNPRLPVPLVKRGLGNSSRFLTVDRIWNLASRYHDRSRPTERALRDVIESAGRPLSLAQIASELSVIYHKPSETYFQLLGKLLKNESTYFKTKATEYGLTVWLPLTDAEELADILFDNKLKAADLKPYADANQAANWKSGNYADATVEIVEAAQGLPISHKLVGVLAWTILGDSYKPTEHIVACSSDSRLVWINGRWITRTTADRLELLLEQQSQTLAEIVEEPIVEIIAPAVKSEPETMQPEVPVAVAEIVAAEPSPLGISDDDFRAMEQIMVERQGAVDVVDLLALQYEVVPGDPSYRADVETLQNRLLQDSRFMSVGAGRFREPNSLPLFVNTVPESLSYPDFQFVSMDGEIMDEEIAEEGFAGSLRGDIQSPLAQDVGDDNSRYIGDATNGDTVRLVLKAHHKEIGTFPLCQIPDSFFPSDTPVVELMVRDADGTTHDVIVNHDLRMAFNLFGLYEAIPQESGGVFHLHKTSRPYEYRFEATGETDAQVYLETARYEELLGLREQAEESGDVATFDIACEVVDNHPKGLDFVQIMTEVNVVRRVTRRKLASILSNYFCFMQKPGQPLWRFDSKKRDMGTDRTKRKYIQR